MTPYVNAVQLNEIKIYRNTLVLVPMKTDLCFCPNKIYLIFGDYQWYQSIEKSNQSLISSIELHLSACLSRYTIFLLIAYISRALYLRTYSYT